MLALAVNLMLLVALLSMLQATLTLPGIAAIALTLGMAIDANVLINERIREELRNGTTPQAAIHAGYERAWATILDSNITTLIAGIALFMFGTGPVRGFAVVHCLGILTSMFSAVVVSRAHRQPGLRRPPQARATADRQHRLAASARQAGLTTAPRPPADGIETMEFFRIRKDIPFMRHALVFNIISLITVPAGGVLPGHERPAPGRRVHRRHGDGGALRARRRRRRACATLWRSIELGDATVQNFGSSETALIRLPVQART